MTGAWDLPAGTSRQATVSDFDPATGGGRVLFDDGVEVGFGPDAFARGGLRLLRRGQRVRLELGGGAVPEVRAVHLATGS